MFFPNYEKMMVLKDDNLVITFQEATSFGQPWKTPCTIVYKQVKLPKELFNHSTPNPHELFTPFNIIPVS